MSLTLYAANNGFYADVPVSKALEFESSFLAYVRANHPQVLENIDKTCELSSSDEGIIKSASQ